MVGCDTCLNGQGTIKVYDYASWGTVVGTIDAAKDCVLQYHEEGEATTIWYTNTDRSQVLAAVVHRNNDGKLVMETGVYGEASGTVNEGSLQIYEQKVMYRRTGGDVGMAMACEAGWEPSFTDFSCS